MTTDGSEAPWQRRSTRPSFLESLIAALALVLMAGCPTSGSDSPETAAASMPADTEDLGSLLEPIRESFAALPAKGWALVYFSAVGLGFMGFEITLIQKLTLFLGYPTYTLTVTLFALLVFSGIGSLLTERYAEGGKAPIVVLTLLFALTLFLLYGLDPVTRALAPQPLALRIGVTLIPLGALGLCLGAFMPLGLRTLSRRTASERRAEYVAWGWAVHRLADCQNGGSPIDSATPPTGPYSR